MLIICFIINLLKFPHRFLIQKLISRTVAEIPHRWPGVGLFLQNAFIFIASLIYKFGRSEDVWSN